MLVAESIEAEHSSAQVNRRHPPRCRVWPHGEGCGRSGASGSDLIGEAEPVVGSAVASRPNGRCALADQARDRPSLLLAAWHQRQGVARPRAGDAGRRKVAFAHTLGTLGWWSRATEQQGERMRAEPT